MQRALLMSAVIAARWMIWIDTDRMIPVFSILGKGGSKKNLVTQVVLKYGIQWTKASAA